MLVDDWNREGLLDGEFATFHQLMNEGATTTLPREALLFAFESMLHVVYMLQKLDLSRAPSSGEFQTYLATYFRTKADSVRQSVVELLLDRDRSASAVQLDSVEVLQKMRDPRQTNPSE